MTKCVKIDLSNKVYGGRVYENQIIESLSDKIEFKRVYLLKYRFKPLNIPRIIWLYIKYHFFFSGMLFLESGTTWFASKNSNNIIVIHHFDTTLSKGWHYLYQRFCDNYFLSNIKYYNTVVTVAKCWQQKLCDLGINNVHIVYNSFNPKLYIFSEEQKLNFRHKYGFDEKPLIYLGNCQRKKGVVESYNALKELGYQLVTSGIKDVELPIPNLNLSYEEYRLLLASSDVVLTMSKFLEGWNRTAHEAALCGTPVIGSGSGGMEELLEISGQITCKSFDDIKEKVKEVLNNPSLTKNSNIKLFDLDYFTNSWLKILT